jgi:4-amino-4-deoxy-L-arabinose transferase-like glycosyltransferase
MAHAASPALRARARSLAPWKVPVGLWAAAALGLAIRLYVVLVARPTCEPYTSAGESCRTIGGDSLYFYLQGERLAGGQWFVNPLIEANQPMAGDPPVFASFLALLGKVGIDTPQGQRVATCVVGAVGVVLIGLLAGRLGGARVAVVAGVLAATYPMLWINDGQLMSESVYIPLIATLLLAAYQLYDRPTVGRALALGALVSLAALTRGEAVLFFPLLVVPLVLGFRRLPLLRRAALCGVAGVAGALVLAPWFIFNLSRFEVPSTMSSSPGSVMLSSACDRGYSGDLVGYYSFECLVIPVSELDPVPADADKSVEDAAVRAAAQRYLSDNIGELPRVAMFRVGRIWELYRPLQNVDLNDMSESRGRFASEAGLAMYVVLVPLAAVGLWVLHRRDLPVTPFLGLAVTATVVAALTFGVTRYRVPVDVGLVVLAALAIDAAWRRWSSGVRPRVHATGDDEGADTADGALEDELVGAPT